jgi:hypothetical protein
MDLNWAQKPQKSAPLGLKKDRKQVPEGFSTASLSIGSTVFPPLQGI